MSVPAKVFLIVATMMALSACGRRGDLEPPSAAVASPATGDRHNLGVRRANSKITPPKKDFVLDPLLQ